MKLLTHQWLTVLAILFLIGAVLFNFPFAYYQLMNWVVVIAALMIAKGAKNQGNMTAAVWIFVGVAIVFNPIAPLYLRSDLWKIADILAIILFITSIFKMSPRRV